jgi:hypothetical protein
VAVRRGLALHLCTRDFRVGSRWYPINTVFDRAANNFDDEFVENVRTLLPVDIGLKLALDDYALALARPNDTAHFCYRGLESIRNALAGDPGKKAAEWNFMHKCLETNKESLEPVKDLAEARRHGRAPAISEEDRLLCLSVLANVLIRYVNYRVDSLPKQTEKSAKLPQPLEELSQYQVCFDGFVVDVAAGGFAIQPVERCGVLGEFVDLECCFD